MYGGAVCGATSQAGSSSFEKLLSEQYEQKSRY